MLFIINCTRILTLELLLFSINKKLEKESVATWSNVNQTHCDVFQTCCWDVYLDYLQRVVTCIYRITKRVSNMFSPCTVTWATTTSPTSQLQPSGHTQGCVICEYGERVGCWGGRGAGGGWRSKGGLDWWAIGRFVSGEWVWGKGGGRLWVDRVRMFSCGWVCVWRNVWEFFCAAIRGGRAAEFGVCTCACAVSRCAVAFEN